MKLANGAIHEGIKKLEGHLTRFIDRTRSDKNYSDATQDISRYWQELYSLLSRHISSFQGEVITSPVTIIHSEISQFSAL